jgi:uncharacterized protein YbbK (DUF523 family)
MEKKNIVLNEKITIGISACCMGSPVRYNNKGWDMLAGLGRERNDFMWCPVCPETMSGLGVPRDPIHLSGGDGSMVWLDEARIKNRRGRDVTEEVKLGCIACLETLKRSGASAYIYMDGSPTCGVYRTSLKKQKRGNPPGIFGSILLQEELFLIPATDVQSPIKWWDWRRRLLAFTWFKNLNLENKDDLYKAWYVLKFLCQEIDDNWAREMGRTLANLEKNVEAETILSIRKEILETLRKPSTVKKITHSLWKNYAYYRKTKGETVEGINSPDFRRNVTTIAKELLLMERTAFEEDVFFATSPVIYRDKRRMPKVEPEDIEMDQEIEDTLKGILPEEEEA